MYYLERSQWVTRHKKKKINIIWRKHFWLFKCCKYGFNEQPKIKKGEQWANIEDKSSIKTTSNIKAKYIDLQEKSVWSYDE